MDLRRLDAVIQFLSATNAQLENWDTPIPNNVLMYCPETRLVKLGENKKWIDTPVFIDFNVFDAVNTLIQQMLPELNDLNVFAINSASSLIGLQKYTQEYIKNITALKDILDLQYDENGNVITSDVIDQLNDFQQSLTSLSQRLETMEKTYSQGLLNLSTLIDNNNNATISNIQKQLNEDLAEFANQLATLKSTVNLISDKVLKATIPIFGSTFPGGPKGYKYGVVLSEPNTSLINPTIIIDDGVYKMWYGDDTNSKVYYATSEDGISWTEQGIVFEDDQIHNPFVTKDSDGTYKMWYDKNIGGYELVHYAISLNGINWTKHGVVLDLGADGDTDDHYVYTPSVLKNSDGAYKMWYAGSNGSHYRIHYATSEDGVNWDKHGVVLNVGANGDTDDYHVYTPSVLKNSDGAYKMWYAGYDGSHSRIHYATSEDGINWTKYGIVIDLGADGDTDNIGVYHPSVLKDSDGTYKMWYTGNDSSHCRIHYATSPNGIDWTKQGVVLDLGANGDTDDAGIYHPFVFKDSDGTYKMWYAGNDGSHYRIHYATSSDGINWTKHGVVVDVGVSGDTDDRHIRNSSVLKDSDGTYKMWYTGYDGSHYRIHYATSEDGINWTKHGIITANYCIIGNNFCVTIYDDLYHAWYIDTDGIHYATSEDGVNWDKQGLVITPGSVGETDNEITSPFVIRIGSFLHMWYVGSDGTTQRVHYARSSDGINWVKYGPIFGPGDTNATDSEWIDDPCVIQDIDLTYKMWYSGSDGSYAKIHLFLTEQA